VAELREDLTRAFSELEPVALACDACTRPIDPLTGLCALHGSDERVSASPRGRLFSETRPTLPSEPPDSDSGIVAAILGADGGGLRNREDEALAAAGFLRNHAVGLELIGGLGSGKSALLAGIGRGAERQGLRPIRAGADPRLALTPWYPIREMIRGALGLAWGPVDEPGLAAAATRLGLAERCREGLTRLFGLGRPQTASGSEVRAAVRRAVVDALVAAAGRGAGLCVLADDAHEWDRASQWLGRSLGCLEDAPGLKIVLASEQGILAPTEERPGIRLGPRDAAWDFATPLASLPGPEADVLATIAVIGREVPVGLLAAVHGEGELLLALGLLERDGWIAVGPDRAVSVAHPLAARAVLDGLSGAGLKARHRAVSDALGPGTGVFVAARHAVEGGDHERAVELLAGAGVEACRAGDEETAGLVHFQRARHVARWELLWAEDDESYLRLSIGQGRALAGSGHRLAAEMVLKEVLANAGRYPELAESARKGLASLGAA
jgi:hypothetical protein